MSLTPKQQAFAVAFVKSGNASEAYRKAYDAKGMSAASVGKEANRLVTHPQVAPYIEELRAPIREAAVESVGRTVEELKKIGHESNPTKDGEVIKFADKLKALDMLMKHEGNYERDNKQRAPNLAIQVNFE